jgi:hypothetical protein
MTATYEKLGFKFLYPENWKLTDGMDSTLPGSISLESPDGNAFWSVHVYPADADQDEILKATIVTLQETYPDLEVASIRTDFEDRPGTGIQCLFFCLDFLIRVRLQVIKTDEHQLLFWFQAEDREFEKLELVFKAMATSILSES